MTTPQLGPTRFHHLAAEYRSLAKTRPTQKEKTELLDLAARYTALAELDLWKPRRRGIRPPAAFTAAHVQVYSYWLKWLV